MASAEESSSSGGPPSVDSYIGSVISLTSKSEIRYEGVLVSINPKESTIALQNVKSFGTEGRRKEGPQITPSDRVYEYILFRGSDIKDLQVKAPSSISTKQQTHNEPAIIQPHYAYAPAASAGIGAPMGLNSNTVNQDLPRQPFPDTHSLYQTGGHLNSWAPSRALANTSGSMHSQGYGSTSNVHAHTQQRPVPFQPPASLQNPLQYSEAYAPTSMPKFPETATTLTFPPQYASSYPPNSSSMLYGNTSLPSSLPSPLPALSSLASSNQELNTTSMISNKAGTSQTTFLPVSSMPFTTSSVLGSTSGTTTVPPLLTADQLAMSIPPATSSLQKLYPESKDMGALLPTNSSSTISGIPQEPLLPLPVPSQQGERGTRQFSEEFDFTAMNEKFNKDEVWGSLAVDGTEDDTVYYNAGFSEGYVQEAPKPGSQPVYNKDDFFDTLSCNSLNRGGWNGRTRLSERMKLDTETFGEFQQRPPMGHGPHANYRAPHYGYYRGSYNRGRGYGYYGGRGHGGYSSPF